MDLAQVVQRAIDYIEENLCGDLDHDDVARESYVSTFYLRRMFPLVCGTTLGEYIRNRRLSSSTNDLLNSDATILEIALKYGYGSPEGYTRAFYRYYGVTPSAARSRRCMLDSFERISVESLLKGELNSMENLKDRGYSVKGSDLIYHTMDMDRTAKWFVDILGWHAGIDARDDADAGIYGCALPFPGELVHMDIAGFNGIHFFRGEPIERTIGFIRVKGIDGLYDHIIKNGWTEVTPVARQPWGGWTCHVTTIDNCVLMFSDIDTKE